MIEHGRWQPVPGAPGIDIFPIITRPSVTCSNCYLLRTPDELMVIDPGGSAEQTAWINRLLREALAQKARRVLTFLTHCHQDHAQGAGHLQAVGDVPVAVCAHEAGARALEAGDPLLTTAFLSPGEDRLYRGPIAVTLFAAPDLARGASTELRLPDSGVLRLDTSRLALAPGRVLQRQRLRLAGGNWLELYHTPGHSACSITLGVGELLFLVTCRSLPTLACAVSPAGTRRICSRRCKTLAGF
jgi:glyoxylase-like metal-dependent hydrolase (beta-lactamase superfamily II)